MTRDDATIALSLISHTNVGKTTLARTLLREDVGEVLDQAHVTEEAQEFVMLERDPSDPNDPRGRLVLWDTPGFGDSVRLLRRLEGQRNPLGWLLKQAWDRFADRPLWCSQQAVRHVQSESDAVLYLANASEDPAMAGYVEPEMRILEWIGKPVIVVLNQLGAPGKRAEREAGEQRWREHLAPYQSVREVLSLDAFTRCWVEEGVLLECVCSHLPPGRQERMGRLVERFRRENLRVYRAALGHLADGLAAAASDREALSPSGAGRRERRRAAELLARRLERATRSAITELIALHGLEGDAAASVEARTLDVSAPREKPMPWRAGVLGGAAGGALGGLAADLAIGGLSFGGGAVAGAILGAMGLGGLAWGYQQIGGAEPRMTWSDEFLDRAARDWMLRYLAVAHFGRGSGPYRDREHPDFWREAVRHAVESRRGALRDAWSIARGADAEEARADSAERLLEVLDASLREVLTDIYPDARGFLAL